MTGSTISQARTGPLYTWSAAQQLAGRGDPWRVRLEFVGSNDKNKSGYSSKFWEVSGVGWDHVQASWGPIGGTPQSTDLEYRKVGSKVTEKLRKGYVFARGSADSASAAPSPPPSSPPSAPPTPSEPNPYDEIAMIKEAEGGVYSAYDEDGNYLMKLPRSAVDELKKRGVATLKRLAVP